MWWDWRVYLNIRDWTYWILVGNGNMDGLGDLARSWMYLNFRGGFRDCPFDEGGDEVVEDGEGGEEFGGVVDAPEGAYSGADCLNFLDC
jgi:hypothetical protein